MPKEKRKKKPVHQDWYRPMKVTFRMAEASYEMLVVKAREQRVKPSVLMRFYIERGMGMTEPGLSNADWMIWSELEPKDPY